MQKRVLLLTTSLTLLCWLPPPADSKISISWNPLKRQDKCPVTETQQDFQTGDYLGKWYELYRSVNLPFQTGDCVTAMYSLKPNNQIRVINSEARYMNQNEPGGTDGTQEPKSKPIVLSSQPHSQAIQALANYDLVDQQSLFAPPLIQPKNPKSPNNKLKPAINSQPGNRIQPNKIQMKEVDGGASTKVKKNYAKQYLKDKQGREFMYRQAEGMAKRRDKSKNDGRFKLKFSIFQPVWGNYDVLETDYASYSIIYSCRTAFFRRYKREFVWVITREPLDPVKTPEEYERITTIAKKVVARNVPGFDFDASLVLAKQTDRNDCYYPDEQQ